MSNVSTMILKAYIKDLRRKARKQEYPILIRKPDGSRWFHVSSDGTCYGWLEATPHRRSDVSRQLSHDILFVPEERWLRRRRIEENRLTRQDVASGVYDPSLNIID